MFNTITAYFARNLVMTSRIFTYLVSPVIHYVYLCIVFMCYYLLTIADHNSISLIYQCIIVVNFQNYLFKTVGNY